MKTAPIIRWMATRIQPLIADDVRASINEEMRGLDSSDPHAFARWASLTATDIARSLPSDDPWLTGTTTVYDDIAPLMSDDPRDDPTTIAFASGLTDEQRVTLKTACLLDSRKLLSAWLHCRARTIAWGCCRFSLPAGRSTPALVIFGS